METNLQTQPRLTGDNYSRAKAAILKYVMLRGQFTIPEIVELTGFSTTSIAKYVNTMKEEGLISILSYKESNEKGRRAIIYGIQHDSCFFLGVEVRAFELNIGLMNFLGEIVESRHIPEFTYENTRENLEQACDYVSDFLSSLSDIPSDKIKAACISLSGRVNSRLGTSASLYNLEELRDSSLAEMLSEKFRMPFFVENDTKAMAMAEYMANGSEGWKDVLYVNISWGLGLGIILNGELYYGKDGYSGEMGHMYSYNNNILCHCGKKGCMETEVSARAIQRKLTERIRNGEASILSGKIKRGETVTADDIISATEKEDSLCIELVSSTGTELGKQLAGLINLFNPEAIIIGGKLSKVSPFYFLQYVSLAIKQYSLKLISKNVPVLTSRLGDLAGITGTCMIARDRSFFN